MATLTIKYRGEQPPRTHCVGGVGRVEINAVTGLLDVWNEDDEFFKSFQIEGVEWEIE